MSHLLRGRPLLAWRRSIAAVLVFTTLSLVSPLRADDLAQLDTSLKWIPADAAFYGSMLRNREQLDIILKSKAWAELQSLPAVKFAWQKLDELWKQEHAAMVKQALEQPENKQLLSVLGDMFSNEVFVFGGKNFTDSIKVAQEIYGAAQWGPLFALLRGGAAAANAENLQAKILVEALAEKTERLRIPDLVIGFKLKDTAAAQAQLKRLDELVKILVTQVPQLKDAWKQGPVAGRDFYTLTLDGNMVPWDEVPFHTYIEKPDVTDKLKKKLKEMKATIALGVRDGYLLLSIGETTAVLENLGKGERLIDRAELKPLAAFAQKRLTSVSYASKELTSLSSMLPNDVDELLKTGKQLLEKAELDEQLTKRLQADMQELAKDAKKYLPAPGAYFAFTFLTDRGQESYTYNWSKNVFADSSRPLALLNHVGGSPLVAILGRTKTDPDAYPTFVKWVRKGYGYFETYGVPNLPTEVTDKYAEFIKEAKPLFQRLDDVTRTLLIPSLADQQTAFVLDAKITSKQWHVAMPPGDQSLPMLEPAVVMGVSDAEKLKTAMREYRGIANELLAAARRAAPEIPELKIPEPESQKLRTGEVYFYVLPPFLGVDAQIIPSGGLSEKVATLGVSHQHTERLLTSTPLKVDRGPLADVSRPRSSAVYVDFAGILDAAGPWIEYAFKAANITEKDQIEGFPGNPVEQVRSALRILKVLRTYTSSSYVENGVNVTHGELIVRDLKK